MRPLKPMKRYHGRDRSNPQCGVHHVAFGRIRSDARKAVSDFPNLEEDVGASVKQIVYLVLQAPVMLLFDPKHLYDPFPETLLALCAAPKDRMDGAFHGRLPLCTLCNSAHEGTCLRGLGGLLDGGGAGHAFEGVPFLSELSEEVESGLLVAVKKGLYERHLPGGSGHARLRGQRGLRISVGIRGRWAAQGVRAAAHV